jgi:hypothetical protein
VVPDDSLADRELRRRTTPPNPYSVLVKAHRPAITAWTGGDSPRPLDEVTDAELDFCQLLYLEQCEDWMAYWREPLPSEQGQIFWHRARGDAHATFRAFRAAVVARAREHYVRRSGNAAAVAAHRMHQEWRPRDERTMERH